MGPAGAHSSTAEVEHELMDLWNAVEKDKVVQAARRAAAACNKTRMEPSQPPLKKVKALAVVASSMACFVWKFLCCTYAVADH